MTYSPTRPEITWAGDKVKHFSPRENFTVRAIVDHCIGRDAAGNLGTMRGTKSWFESPASRVSAHFAVGFDGSIWQFVLLTNSAWGNGVLENPDVVRLAWLAAAVRDKVNPNSLTVSIEHEGDGVMPMPEPQYQASLSLHRWLLSLFVLPASPSTIVRHSQITGRNRANCPGKSFPMERLLRDLGAAGKPASIDFIDPITQIAVSGPMADFYVSNGGLRIFGRPITKEQPALGLWGKAKTVQWFERARFELQADNVVYLGLVGRESYQNAI